MYAALNQRYQLTYAINGQLGENYYCPQCYLPVQFIMATTSQRPHFRHYSRPQDYDGETALHLQGKVALQSALQKLGVVAEQEVTLGTDERRADVLWHAREQTYAFEFQCAILSVAELQQRHSSYQALKVTDIWLLGQTYLNQYLQYPTKKALKFISYRYLWGYFVAVWLPEKATVRVFHHLAFTPPQSQVVFKRTDYTLAAFLQGYLQISQGLTELPLITLNFDPSYWLAQQLNFQCSSWLSLQTACYEHGLNLLSLPTELWLPRRLPPLSRSWSTPLKRQISLFMATGELTWQQRSQLYLSTKWPLIN
ncbi:competence protein CoiA [Lapidilactobacillus bayanensis]|uniref:competence protein CoiA n=1 Tax=Lapidilactobacillus bayanensis TaxID=2485998 RepID=UPI000F7844DC|nr:competence protein CoiA family protein [Lapidilactobacillus bayanensis]